MTKEEFKNLFETSFDEVRRYILYRSGDSEAATDIAQEVFLKVWEKNRDVALPVSKGLLFKIAADKFISRYRREKLAFNFFRSFHFNEQDYSPEELMSFQQLKSAYETALERMPEKQRTVFLMSRVEKLKYHEIAGLLGLSVKAVEKRMKHALEFLRISLDIK